ncbi:MAG: hypothetical protein R8P61_35800 [Bacteroidia bacterium]|nr:hypothetical protein [Bacteroidia bacterium]
MQNKCLLALGLFMMVFFANTKSQNDSQNFPLKISVLDESITFPSFNFLSFDYNPAILIGTEYQLKENRNSECFIAGNLGFLHHKEMQTAVFLTTEFAYRRYFGPLSLRIGLGPGYLYGFATGPVYRVENGNYEEIGNSGTPYFLVSATAELGYRLGEDRYSPELFISWSNSVELPLNAYTTAHQLVGIGIKIYPFKKKH